MLLVPDNWTALFLSPEYGDFTTTLELDGNNNKVFKPQNYINVRMTWVCFISVPLCLDHHVGWGDRSWCDSSFT